MSLLRETIRLMMLQEAAVTPQQAAQEGLALFDGEYGAILYRPTQPIQIVAGIVGEVDEWGVTIIKGSGAEGGYGPLMYDIAMALWTLIGPDTRGVSSSAQKVWEHYRDHRPDVVVDHEMYMRNQPDGLNFTVRHKSKPDLSALHQNHKNYVEQMGGEVESQIDAAAREYIEHMVN